MNDAMRKVPDHLFFATGLPEALVAEAWAAGRREIGGLLLGREPGRVRRFVSLPNAAARPDEHFRADLPALVRALNMARRSGWRLEGLFHSHPSAPPRPSPYDMKHCMEDLPLLLVGSGTPALRGYIRRGATWLEIRLAAWNEMDG
ncbi:MAG TPA: hypothetical protein ENK43_17120 [Planctomycetes bacterium]|nr:hypothetical protein [Planctomycetota bacterium]